MILLRQSYVFVGEEGLHFGECSFVYQGFVAALACAARDDFAEFAFRLPFGDLVAENWSAAVLTVDGRELVAIAAFIGVVIDPAQVLFDYKTRPLNGDAAVFYRGQNDHECLLLLDFTYDATDQSAALRNPPPLGTPRCRTFCGT